MKFSSFFNRLVVIQSKIELLITYIAAFMLAAMMFLVTLDVFLRYVFNMPMIITFDVVALLMVFTIALSLAYIQKKRGHIAIEMVTEKLPFRPRVVLDIIALTMALIFFIVLIYSSIDLAWLATLRGEFSESIARIHMYPARWAIVLGAGLMCIRLVIDIVQQSARLRSPESSKPGEGK